MPVAREEGDSTSIEKETQIKELENSIKVVTNVVNEKNIEKEQKRKDLNKLKLELEKKVSEMQEKDNIIKSLEDEDESTWEEIGCDRNIFCLALVGVK